MNRKEIPHGGDTKAVHETFAVSNDPIGAFLQERCHMSGSIPKAEFLSAFGEFLGEHGLSGKIARCIFKETKGKNSFSQRLKTAIRRE